MLKIASVQHTGINFDKYDDIPVEATGAGVPEPVTCVYQSSFRPRPFGEHWLCSLQLTPPPYKSILSLSLLTTGI
jgi:ATP-dependent RNA helicase DDX3X